MELIVDIKDTFNSPEILEVLSESVFNPTMDRLKDRAEKYMTNPLTHIYSLNIEGKNIGIIVLEARNSKYIEILDFAVRHDMQRNGVGRKLIDFCTKTFMVDSIIAETDDDAIGFYKKVGFKVHSLGDKHGSGINRFYCKLVINK